MSKDFWDRGYVVIDDLLDSSQIDFVSTAMDLSERNGLIRDRGEAHFKNAKDEYSPVLGALFLRECRERIEQAVGRDLLQAYAYWRIYYEGADLVRHIDRKASEIAVSITIGSDPAEAEWPIFVEDFDGNETRIDLPPGAAIIYLGSEIMHWREQMHLTSHKQLMLFYVLKEGEFADHEFDQRGMDPLSDEAVGTGTPPK